MQNSHFLGFFFFLQSYSILQTPEPRGMRALPLSGAISFNSHVQGTPPWPPPPAEKKKQFFDYFLVVFPYIWPLAGPNIAKKGWPLPKTARVHRQTHLGTLNFWAKPLFDRFEYLFLDLGTSSPGCQPFQPISRPCSTEKYPSSRMGNRYTRIFDAG